MRIHNHRLVWTDAAAILAAWFLRRGDVAAPEIPIALEAALGARLIWPLLAARLPKAMPWS